MKMNRFGSTALVDNGVGACGRSRTSRVGGRAKMFSVFFASALVIGACGGGGSTSDLSESTSSSASVAETTTSTQAETTTTVPLPEAPLTGLPAPDLTVFDRPAIVAKIDNHPAARPQSGLIEADIVFEENVEGWTRFAAVLHSKGSDPVGPIRSGRSQDVDLLAALNSPLLLWSGGNPAVTKIINNSTLVNMSPFAPGIGGAFFRAEDKGSPHNLYSNTSKIWELGLGKGGIPSPIFEYRDESDVINGDDVVGVKVSMDGDMRASWEWDPSVRRFMRMLDGKRHNDPNGNLVNTDNVIIMVCEYRRSQVESRSPEAVTTGTGVVWVLTDGKVVEGTWSRPDSTSPWTFTDSAGNPIKLTPGRTWVELVRDGQAALVPAGAPLESIPWPS